VILTLKPPDGVPRNARRNPRHAAAPAIRGETVTYAALLVLIVLLIPLHRWWSVQIILVPMLLIIPGAILLRALRIPGKVVSSFPVYVPCASIVVLFGSGLVVDLLGPLIGVAEPLRTAPFLIGLETTCFAMLAVSVNAPPDVAIEWRSLLHPARVVWPFILPVLAAAGALRLNSNHSSGIALIAVSALIIVLVGAAALSMRLEEKLLEIILYTVGLALTWSDSLRGDPLYGFDIATEYQRLQETVAAGIWHTGHPNDAYGAMLSLTIMPAGLHALSGLSALLVFKVVYPAIYALFPVAIYGLGRRILSRRWAFIAAAFTIGQYAFAELAGFARQEIALVLFGALIAATLDSRIRRRSQWALIALLGLAVALSHYSTTYVAVTVIGLMIPLQWALSWLRDIPRVTGAVVIAFGALFAGAVIWYGPVTHSDSHVLEVVQTVQSQGLDLLPNRVPGGGLISDYLQGNARTPIPAERYAQLVHASYSVKFPFIKPLPDASLPQYHLHNSPVPEPPVKWRLGYDSLSLSLLIIEQLANLLAAIGALFMIFRRDASGITRQIGLLALATTLLLTVLRFSGTLAVTYGQERAQLQGLVLLGVALSWTLQGFFGAHKRRQTYVAILVSACLAVVLFNTTYLISPVLGGETSVNLANNGPAFEYFYTTAPEIASAKWLGENVRPGQLVYSDEYGQVPLVAVTGIQQGLFVDLTPLTLNQNAWVYASNTNVADGRAFALYNENIASYVFPTGFLSANYNLVYTDGTSEVFHR
jgi:uncharacterized membrane protein